MAQRVTLDAMIPREDFAVSQQEFVLDLFRDFPIANLVSDSAMAVSRPKRNTLVNEQKLRVDRPG